MSNPLIIVVGAGPGIGASVARRFGRDGYGVALIARRRESLEELGAALQNDGITTGWTPLDITDADALTEAITRFGTHSGSIQHLHFNPSVLTPQRPLELSAAQLLRDINVGAASLLTAVQAARPFLHEGARITATGATTADRPWPAATSLGVQKAALRNLVAAFDGQLKADGIRAMSLTVTGTVQPGTPFDPDLIANALFEAAGTPDKEWRTEIRYTGLTA